MKKVIFTVITVLYLASVEAQFEKGSKWVAGSATISAGTSESNQTSTYNSKDNRILISFRPSINTFVSDKVMNSVFLGYTYDGSNTDYNGAGVTKNQYHTIQLGFGKTHINPLYGKIYSTITTNLYGQYNYGKGTRISNIGLNIGESINKNYSANVNLGLGLMYRASDRFAITTSLNNFFYGSIASSNQKSNSTGNPETTSKGFSINGGFGLSGFNLGNLQFGLMYRLKGKQAKQ